MRDESNYFNPATYAVIDRITGEEVPVDIFIREAGKNGWEKAYAEVLAEYYNIAGSQAADVLSYFLISKDSNNRLITTRREVVEATGASYKTVSKVFKCTLDAGFIRKKRNGYYMVNPNLMKYGGEGRGVLMLRMWYGLGDEQCCQ